MEEDANSPVVVVVNDTEKTPSVTIVGAGLTGSLMAVYMAKRGYKVDVYERRNDPRKEEIVEGRSINLALSERGLNALRAVGLQHIGESLGIPMYGRLIHSQEKNAKIEFQKYGVTGKEHLLSISRGLLNERLIDAAEEYPNTKFHWNYKCSGVQFTQKSITFVKDTKSSWNRVENNKNNNNEKDKLSTLKENELTITSDLIIGADGSYSSVRAAMQKLPFFDYSQNYLDHGYKELTLPPGKDGNYQMASHGLHIWPRGEFMMIGLPNLDKTFTITLFMPWKKFEEVNTPEKVMEFFEYYFPDSINLMPDLVDQYFKNPTGSLVWIKCKPYYHDNAFLIGDAAHAVVPFYGQGMNAGLEDVCVFDMLLEKYGGDISKVLPAFSEIRKPDADAISDLAHYNYLEMRSHVNNSSHVFRKHIDNFLNKILPNTWIPLYSMVSFTNIRYSEVVTRSRHQDNVIALTKKSTVILTPFVLATVAACTYYWFPHLFKRNPKL